MHRGPSSGKRTNAPDRADALAAIVLKDQAGADVQLGDLWRERPVALAFLRHYG